MSNVPNASPLSNVFLAFWNLDVKEPVRVSAVREILAANNLNPERAADVQPSTALRRAVESLRSKEQEAKCWTSKETQKVRAQVDEVTEEDGKLRRRFLSQYELTEDGVPQHIAGQELDAFMPAFEHASSHYTGGDISKVIQAILDEDGLGSYSPRKNGGVYFVPVKPDAADLLQRIERFCSAVSVRFLTYTVPDTNAQREEIADAIATAFLTELQSHAEAIAAYTTDTKPGIVDNRRESLNATSKHMDSLSNLMNGRLGSLRMDLAGLLEKLNLLEIERSAQAQQAAQRSEEEAQVRQQAGGRRIVTNVA